MKKYIVAFIAVLLIALCAPVSLAAESSGKRSTLPPEWFNKPAEQDEALVKALHRLIDELYSVMAQPHEKEPARRVYDVYAYVKEKIVAGDIIWGIKHDDKEEMFAAFAPAKNDEKSRIELNEYLLKRSKTEPTIALAMIIHEMKHAYDYFTVGDQFVKDMENPLGAFMYEMDALFIETLFVKDYLVSKHKQLTPFEKLLIESLEKDNLALVSLLFLAVDMDFTYHFYRQGGNLDKNLITCKDYLRGFIYAGKELQKLSLMGNDFEKYSNLISIYTYARMTSPLIQGAFSRNPTCSEDKETAATIKEINDYIRRANAIIEEHASFMQDFMLRTKEKYFGYTPHQK